MASTKHYIWRCLEGVNLALLENVPDVEMENLDASEVKTMLDGVYTVLGTNDHTHIFSEHPESPEGIVIYDCPGKKLLNGVHFDAADDVAEL